MGQVVVHRGAVGGSGSGAPTDAVYIVGSADATLSAERVVTDTATVAWDLGTAAQAKANVPDGSITYAKIQDVSAASRLLGRGSAAGSGDTQEISLGSGLSMSGTTLSSSGGGVWTYVTKGSDESTLSDTTVSNDTDLLVSLSASTNYIIELVVYYSCAAAGDLKWTLNGPASPTRVIFGGRVFIAGAVETSAATSYTSEIACVGSGTDGILLCYSVIENGANAGTLNFMWAQNSSTGTNTTIRKGSYLRYRTF